MTKDQPEETSRDRKRRSLEQQALMRKERLAKQLRDNLMRRKAQVRARREGQEDGRENGIAAAHQSDTIEDQSNNEN